MTNLKKKISSKTWTIFFSNKILQKEDPNIRDSLSYCFRKEGNDNCNISRPYKQDGDFKFSQAVTAPTLKRGLSLGW